MKESDIKMQAIIKLQLPSECFIVIMKYLDLGDIMKSLMPLSKEVRNQVIT